MMFFCPAAATAATFPAATGLLAYGDAALQIQNDDAFMLALADFEAMSEPAS